MSRCQMCDGYGVHGTLDQVPCQTCGGTGRKPDNRPLNPAADPRCAQPACGCGHEKDDHKNGSLACLGGWVDPETGQDINCECDDYEPIPAPDPTCANADCGDVEKLRDALQAVVEKLRVKAGNWREHERVARNNGDNAVMDISSGKASAFYTSARLLKDALESTAKPLSAQPAEPVHDQLRMRVPVWHCPTCKQKFYTSAEYDAHRELEAAPIPEPNKEPFFPREGGADGLLSACHVLYDKLKAAEARCEMLEAKIRKAIEYSAEGAAKHVLDAALAAPSESKIGRES